MPGKEKSEWCEVKGRKIKVWKAAGRRAGKIKWVLTEREGIVQGEEECRVRNIAE